MPKPLGEKTIQVEQILRNATHPLAQSEVQKLSGLTAAQVRTALNYLVVNRDDVHSEMIAGTLMREYSVKR